MDRKRTWEAVRRFAIWRQASIVVLLAGLLLLAAMLADWPSGLWSTTNDRGEEFPRRLTEWVGQFSAIVTIGSAAAALFVSGLGDHARQDAIQKLKSDLDALRRTHRREITRRDLLDRLRTSLTLLHADLCQVLGVKAFQDVTVKAYCVDATAEPAHLTTTAKVSGSLRDRTGIVWTQGKGAIGIAWRDGRANTTDLHRPDRLKAARMKETWDQASETLRQGLEHSEVLELLDRPYQIVVASPIRRDSEGGEVVGVFAIDAPSRLHAKLRDDTKVKHSIALGTLTLQDDMTALYDLIHD